MLGIAHEGMTLPLLWQLLPKAGSSRLLRPSIILSKLYLANEFTLASA